MIAWVILLFVMGAILIVIEFFIPGLVAGIMGGALIVASTILGCIYYPDYLILVILAEIVGATVVIVAGLVWFPQTRAARMMVLESTLQPDEGYVSDSSNEELVGLEYEVFTPLRPVGTILVDNKRVSAVSNGEFIGKGERVRVTEVHGNRVVVERAGEEVDPSE